MIFLKQQYNTLFSNILLSINSADDFLLGKVLPVRVNKNFTSENRFPHGGDRAVVGSRHSLLLLLVSSTTNKKFRTKPMEERSS